MSSFPAQFVDMTVDRGLFDHTGAQPPATKITVELPPEYIEKPEPDATPPYSEFRVDAKVLADIQTAVMREYGGVARRCLNAFRQDVGLGDLAINGRRTNLGAGVGMNYTSQFGNESIRIHVSKEVVRRLLGSEEDLYMLVLFTKGGGYYIGYIPMDKIDDPAADAKYRRSEGSGWEYGGAAQLKISDDIHVAAAGLLIDKGGNISKEDKRHFYNTKQTLLGPVASVPYPPTEYEWEKPINAKINYSGKSVFDDLGNKLDFSTPTPAITTPRPWVKYPQAVAAVTKDGGLWGHAVSRPWYVNTVLINQWDRFVSKLQEDTFPGFDADGGLHSQYVAGTVGPEEGSFEAGTVVYVGGPSNSGTIPIVQRLMVYSNNGTVDDVTIKENAGYGYLDIQWASTGNNYHYWSYLGYTGSIIRDYDIYGDYYVHSTGLDDIVLASTYVAGTAGSDNYISYSRNIEQLPGYKEGVITPFRNVEDTAYWTEYLNFCANGKHSFRVMSISTYSGKEIEVTKDMHTDYTNTIRNAFGMANVGDTICAMFLDIKLKDIDKLK